MRVLPLSCGTARAVVGEGDSDPHQLGLRRVQRELKESGLLLFRGFAVDQAVFRTFASRFSAQQISSPGDAKEEASQGDGVQLIVPNGRAQDLHQENGTLASRPDLLWFYCEKPAARRGQTTYADGVRVWQALSARTRRLFLSRRIRYEDSLPRRHWLTPDGYLDIRMHVGRLRLSGSTVRFDEDDTLVREYVTSAVGPSRWGGQLAFTNSLRGPYVHTVTFEDGSPIPQAVLDEIDAVHAQLMQDIPWQAGDMVMIDNTRYVHGRRAFRDRSRQVYTYMSLANF